MSAKQRQVTLPRISDVEQINTYTFLLRVSTSGTRSAAGNHRMQCQNPEHQKEGGGNLNSALLPPAFAYIYFHIFTPSAD